MANQVAFITGASRGIGKTVAERLASLGYDLVISARSTEALAKLATHWQDQYQVTVQPITLDVADYEQVQTAVQEAVNQFGRIDVLFNNAGIAMQGTSELSMADYEAMIQINLLGAIAVANAVAAVMKQQQSGYIFNLGSRSALQARATMGGYAAAKFGLRGYSEALARELAEDNIKVTTLHPGWVQTDMTQNAPCPGEEMLQTSDIADIVACFLSLSTYAHVRDILIEPRRAL